MNIDELRSVQSKERQKSDLQQLRESFYGDVAAYIEELEAERERVASNAEDPFGSPAVQQLTNDIETAKDTAEAIYERRLGKIVKKASLVSAEMANPDDVNGLTAEEQALFADLVARIEANKDHMLDVIAGDAPAGSPAPDIEVANTASDGLQAAVEDATAGDTPEGVDPEVGLSDESTADAAAAPTDGAADEGTDDAREDPPVPDDVLAGGDAHADEESVPAADVMGETDGADGDATVDGDVEADTGTGDAGDADGRDTDESTAADAPERTDGGAVAESTGDATVDGTSNAPETDSSSSAAAINADRATLRVTEDVGEIYGVDEREYSLHAEDVVTLPEENADVLLSQDAAERLD